MTGSPRELPRETETALVVMRELFRTARRLNGPAREAMLGLARAWADTMIDHMSPGDPPAQTVQPPTLVRLDDYRT